MAEIPRPTPLFLFLRSMIKRNHVFFLGWLLLAGMFKTLGGVTLYFHRPIVSAGAAAAAIIAGFAASRVLRRNRSDGQLPAISNVLGYVSSAVFGTIMLILLLSDWKGGIAFAVLLLCSSPSLLALLPPGSKSASP